MKTVKYLFKIFLLIIILSSSLSVSGMDHYETLFGSFAGDFTNQYSGQKRMLESLVGDTITMKFDDAAALRCFRTMSPDTIWLGERPKKNAKIGEDYVVNEAYMGIRAVDGYITPAPKVNDKPFAVTSVYEMGAYSGCYNVTLIDVATGERVIFSLDDCFADSCTFTSARATRVLNEVAGDRAFFREGGRTKIAIPEFIECTLMCGHFQVGLSKPVSCGQAINIHPTLQIELRSDSGKNINYDPFTESNRDSWERKSLLLTQSEYYRDYKIWTVKSVPNRELDCFGYNYPFTFTSILGSVGCTTPVYQKLDPAKSSYPIADAYIDKAIITIGDVVESKNVKYYKACLNGKAFFVKATDVLVFKDATQKLDTLMNCDALTRNMFYEATLATSALSRISTLEDAFKEFERYKALGVAIANVNVYDESYYTIGKGLAISIANPTDTTIKYVTFSAQGYNAVDDPEGKRVTRKCIGPIEAGFVSTYKFDNMWLTDIIQYAQLRSITVEYMDGKVRKIANPKNVMMSEASYKLLFEKNPVDILE